MPTKTMLVLANSIKKAPGRCIAGREVTINGTKVKVGSWIRPVSPDREGKQGELHVHRHCRLADGTSPNVLDVVEMPLAQKRSDPGQPENWEVESGKPWRRVKRVSPLGLAAIGESPTDLWMDTIAKTDRIAVREQLARPNSPSLVLIRPSRLRIHMETVTNARGAFQYGDHHFNLKITDDVFNHKYADHFLGGEEVPQFGDDCMLCISLGTPFRGYSDTEDQHYKLIAAVIPTQ